MKKNAYRVVVGLLCLIYGLSEVGAQTPLEINGRLQLVGNQLSNECGAKVQLRGISTHGPQWFPQCYTNASMYSMRDDWGADIIRLVNYVSTDGYLGNPTTWAKWTLDQIELCEEMGIYAMIDWHVLNPGDPNANLKDAEYFFDYMAKQNAGRKNVIYEICNEPNGSVSWADVKSYAEKIIPIIRKHDKENIIVVGTPTWSQDVDKAAADPLTGDNAYNVMYTFHFYAGSHSYLLSRLNVALTQIPIFVTEWGTTKASGDGGNYESDTDDFMDMLNGGNPHKIRVSWCNWSFADKDEDSALLKPYSCNAQNWTNKTTSGDIVYKHLNTPADNFQECGDSHVGEYAPEQLSIYPNPGAGYFTLDVSHGERVRILDHLGQVLFNQEIEQNQMDLSHLPAGIYFIQTESKQARLVVSPR